MGTQLDQVNIKISFFTLPTEPPSDEWTFTMDPAWGMVVDEHAFEAEVTEALVQAGGANTLSLERRVSWGGWGAEGLRTLDLIVAVGLNVASTVLYETIKALFKRYTDREPKAERGLAQPSTGASLEVDATSAVSSVDERSPSRGSGKAASVKTPPTTKKRTKSKKRGKRRR